MIIYKFSTLCIDENVVYSICPDERHSHILEFTLKFDTSETLELFNKIIDFTTDINVEEIVLPKEWTISLVAKIMFEECKKMIPELCEVECCMKELPNFSVLHNGKEHVF